MRPAKLTLILQIKSYKLNGKSDGMAHTCNPSTRSRGERIEVSLRSAWSIQFQIQLGLW